uniref:Amino acid ABC transporter permease n=1 Tax=Desulfatirhabdium butyrativorans TaxID=340467 RepID=A0A7C4VR73_9BACT
MILAPSFRYRFINRIRRCFTRWTAFDMILLAILVATAAAVGWIVAIRLQYRWNWATLLEHIVRFDPNTDSLVPGALLRGLATTIRLSTWAMLAATPIGLAIALLRSSRRPFNRWTGRTFLELIRNTPPIVVIFIGYYFFSERLLSVFDVADTLQGLPESTLFLIEMGFGPRSHLPAFLSATASIAVIEAVYIAEIIRGGIRSIDHGQIEASDALGLNRLQQLRYVILPQAVRNILPPLSGQFVSTIKDSAIVSVISIPELCFQGTEIISATYLHFEVWITVTLMYAVLTFTLSYGISRLERRVRKHSGSALFDKRMAMG